jgi:hypothetical protein
MPITRDDRGISNFDLLFGLVNLTYTNKVLASLASPTINMASSVELAPVGDALVKFFIYNQHDVEFWLEGGRKLDVSSNPRFKCQLLM